MLAANRRELEALIILAGRIDPSLRDALRRAQGDMDRTSSGMSRFAAGTAKIVGGVVKSAALLGGAITIGLGAAAKQGIALASNLEEVQNVVDVTFGKSAGQINEWSKQTLKIFGLSELAAKQYTGTLGAMMKSSGLSGDAVVTMSKNLTGLSGDLASFHNLDTEKAFEKIRSGISGETEPLKQLGINMSVANMEAFALSKGIKTSYQNMDQASQTALRYAYLMDVSKDAQGDFARTQEGYANQTRLWEENLKQASGALMKSFLPALTEARKSANQHLGKIISKLDEFNGYIEKGAKPMEAFGNVFDGIFGKGKFDGILQAVKPVFKEFQTNFMFIASEGKKIFDELSPSVIELAKTIGPLFGKAFNVVTKTIYPAIRKIQSGFVEFLIPQIKKSVDFIRTTVMPPLTKVFNFIADVVIPKVVDSVEKWMPKIQEVIGKAVDFVIFYGGMLKDQFDIYWPYIKDTVVTAIDVISGVIDGLLTTLSGVIDFVKGVFSGDWELAWKGVEQIFGGIGDALDAIFKGAINGIINAANFFIRNFGKIQIDIPEWIPVVGGKHIGFQIPEIPTFARGGFANRPSVFGEAGLEAAIPIKYKDPRSLSLLNQTARAIGVESAGSGNQIHFTYAPVINGGKKAEIEALLDADKERFKAWLEEFFMDEGRVKFG